MADFTLLEYNGTNTNSVLGKVNSLKKGYKEVMSDYNLMIALENFIKNSRSIEAEYTSKMKETFEEDEVFYYLVPVSSCNYFVNKIKEWISNEFPNSIDISDYFTEREEVDMARLGANAEESLRQSLIISEKLKEQNINKIFIGDDVYSTGTSVKVYKELIQEQFDYEIEFSFGTLIKTQ